MYAQMGLSFATGVADFINAGTEAKMAKALQDYRNTMQALSAARSYNAVTVNEVRTRDQLVQNDQFLQKTAMKDQAAATVAAAAAGVAGNSVDMAMRDLQASAGRASWAQRRQANQALSEMGAQRTSIAIAQISNKDIQVIPKPSVGSLLLGTATSMLNIYDSHQPAGSGSRLDIGARAPMGN